jgi:predicted nucleotidyltransferase component of viral defense system
MKREPSNLAASIRDRLTNRARADGRSFNDILQNYVSERFLYRLSCSKYSEQFILKGALVFTAWGFRLKRSTLDIDLRGYTSNALPEIQEIFKSICLTVVEPDGLTFNTDTLQTEPIVEGADYHGVRIRFSANLGQALIHLQIDIGFADEIFPRPTTISFPSLLGQAEPKIKAYPREAVIAEKFQALVSLGTANSRLKDFYDLFTLASHFDFEGPTLAKSILTTFQSRSTVLPEAVPDGLSDEFAELKQQQWKTLLRRLTSNEEYPLDLKDVIARLRQFLLPPTSAAKGGDAFPYVWKAGSQQWDRTNAYENK